MFFETILPTVDQTVFLNKVFGSTHLFVKETNRLKGRVTTQDIDECLTTWNGFLDTFVLASMNGSAVSISRDEHNPLTQKQQLEALYREGATLKINGFETRHPVIAPLCREFEMMFGGKTFAKAFLTPPGKPGYNIHFDAYDTFVMQLDGTKHWKVFARNTLMPTEVEARELSDEEAGAPIAEYVMEPGDVLYMPSGFPHCARCTDQHSMHITIGFNAWRAHSIAEYVVAALADRNETVRQYILPAQADPDAEAKLKIALMDIASALERIDPRDVLESFQNAARATMPPIRDWSLSNASFESQIRHTAKFAFDPTSFHSYSVDNEAETAYVRLGCSLPVSQELSQQPPHIELPAYVASDLASIFSKTTPFTADEVEGMLDQESRLLLLTELSKRGVVKVVTPA